MIPKLAIVLGFAFSAIIGAVAPAAAGTQPVTQCQAGVNPCAGYQDNTTTQVIAVTIWYDHAGAPIAEVANAGGFKVFGDDVTVYGPGSVSVPVVQLRPDGTILLGDVLWTPHDARFVHCLEQPQMTAAACRKAVT